MTNQKRVLGLCNQSQKSITWSEASTREPEETSRLEEGALCRVRKLTLPPQLEMSLPLDREIFNL